MFNFFNDFKPTLNVYYWNERENCGDYYGKWLLEKMGYNVVNDNTRPYDIAVCGSILEHKRMKNVKKIWGCGFLREEGNPSQEDLSKYYAVRGKLTFDKLNTKSYIAFGDPGLLASKYYTPNVEKKYEYGIVCHHSDENFLRENYPNMNIISMSTNNVEEVIDKINECKFIFSSSLHGIIFAHSYGIPAIRLKISELKGNDFKFRDYYLTFKTLYEEVDVNILENDFQANLSAFLKREDYYKIDCETLHKIQQELLDVFPYQHHDMVICCIAKNEDLYINDFCEYHLNLGFDHIFVFVFKKRLSNSSFEIQAKTIIRGNIPNTHFIECSVHFPKINGKMPIQMLADGTRTYGAIKVERKCDYVYINHYMTKTLDEFINQKIGRGDAGRIREITFDYFFRLNEKTKEKLDYIERWRNDNNINW